MADRFVGMQDWISKLERAKALLDAGALTPEEFEAEKARLLPRLSPAIDDIAGDELSANSRWIKPAIAAALAVVAAMSGYALLTERSASAPPEKARSLPAAKSPANTPTPTPIASPTSTPAPAPKEVEFNCIGAYSNISFSEESGDGSGLFVRIEKSGTITWKYYEGSISRGNVKVNRLSADRIAATVNYADDPNGQASTVVLKCMEGDLSASSANFGDISLRKLTSEQADELDL